MADSSYLIAATWAHNPPSTNRPSVQDRIRSFSSSSKTPPTPTTPTKSLSKSSSTSSLRTMAAVSRPPGLPTPSRLSSFNDNDEMNTLSDPRSRAMTPSIKESPSPQHPDLSDELATLSNKLINAINHQTNLDDSLNVARHELDTARERIRQLEQENDQHDILIARGMLIEKDVVEQEKNNLHKILADERKQRAEVEKEKKSIEQELENLTQALFEEANKMVITAREEARKEQEVILRKNDQLKAQLADTENLLKNHQEQLAELKQVLEQLSMERDDQTDPTEPSTPGLRSGTFDSKDSLGVSELMGAAPEMPEPSYPTSFTHLIHPVLRTDLVSFEDFQALLKISKTSSAPPSRVSSGSYGALGLGLGLSAYTGLGSSTPSVATATSAHSPSVGSAGSFSGVSTPASTPATPASSKGEPTVSTPLKETKFYKRALAEDIEPCLRLDTAPGLSWLARRSVLNSMCDGSLVVEPMPPSTKRFALNFSCSLCGEDRKTDVFARTHRFRTSETDNAQRYPLCKYCLGRVRSSCDFLGFLRMLKDGHWRAEGEEAEKAAWEESVRLREQMFWCRIGGGVVPANLGHNHSQISDSKSPRASEDLERIEMLKLNEELARTGEIKPRDVTPVPAPVETPIPAPAGDDVKTHRRTASANKKGLTVRTDTAAGLWKASQEDAAVPSPAKTKAEVPDTKASTDEAKADEPPSTEPTKKEEEPEIKSEETLPSTTNDSENQDDIREKLSPSPDVVVTSPSTVEEGPSDAKSEDVKSEDIKSEDATSKDVKSEDVNLEDIKSEDIKFEDAKSEVIKFEDAKSEVIKFEDAKSEVVKFEDAKSEEAAPIPGAFE